MRKTYIQPWAKSLILTSESIIAGSVDWGGGEGSTTPGGTGGIGPGDSNDELGTRQYSIWGYWMDE